MTERFVFETEYNRESYEALARLMLTKLRKKPRFLLLFLAGMNLLLGGALASRRGLGVFPVILLTLGFVLLLVVIFLIPLTARLLLKHQGGREIRARISFTDTGFESESEGEKLKRSFEELLHVYELPRYFVLLTTGSEFLLLDKRGHSPEGLRDFRAFLEEKRGSKEEVKKN